VAAQVSAVDEHDVAPPDAHLESDAAAAVAFTTSPSPSPPPSLPDLTSAVNPSPTVPPSPTDLSPIAPTTPVDGPLQAFCDGLSALQLSTERQDFLGAAKLLMRYCDNAGSEPYEPKYRRIRLSNAVYQKHLGRHPTASKCLRAVGFVDGQDAETEEPILIMGTADAELLLACAYAAQRRLQMFAKWPETLLSCLPAACKVLDGDAGGAKLLDELTEELAAPHVPQLLAHSDNRDRVAQQLEYGGADAARHLLANLVELRGNLTAAQGSGSAGSGGGSPTHPSRVRHMRNNEEWYDTLMAAKGLVVVDFGAAWCKPCQQVKPLFDALSSAPGYEGVTFLSVDADECPVLIGDNRIESFPTFKFFRNSAEEDLPVVGADIEGVRERIDELIGGIGA